MSIKFNIFAVLIKFGIWQFCLIASVAILAVCVGVAIPIIKLLKAKPVDIIAGRK